MQSTRERSLFWECYYSFSFHMMWWSFTWALPYNSLLSLSSWHRGLRTTFSSHLDSLVIQWPQILWYCPSEQCHTTTSTTSGPTCGIVAFQVYLKDVVLVVAHGMWNRIESSKYLHHDLCLSIWAEAAVSQTWCRFVWCWIWPCEFSWFGILQFFICPSCGSTLV